MTRPSSLLTVAQARIVDSIYNLRDSPHDLGESYPHACRTAYLIGYIDALAAAGKLLSSMFSRVNEGEDL